MTGLDRHDGVQVATATCQGPASGPFSMCGPGVGRPLGELRIPFTAGIHARATRFARRGDTHMDESTRNTIIVDAKRQAKAHSRATGEPHQRSLDHVARTRDRDDWAAFIADPVAHPGYGALGWFLTLDRICRKKPNLTIAIALSFTTFSMAVINLEGASRLGLLRVHVPIWLWLPCMIAWAAIFAMMSIAMLMVSVRALKRMSRGVVDIPHVYMLIMTIIMVFWALTVWRAIEDIGDGISVTTSLSVIGAMIITMIVSISRAGRKSKGRRASRRE